jgi:anaerobic magnesium-protoporphyrin IX monomethyl ester cyclase
MTDILLTHSYFLRLDSKEFRAMMPYPPLGTLYAAALLRERGYSVALFDSMLAGGTRDFESALTTHRPRLVAIYDDDFNYLSKMCLGKMRGAAFTMIEIARSHGCHVVVHGSDASDHAVAFLQRGANEVILGEGEMTLREVADWRLRGTGDRAAIRGLTFFEDSGLRVTRRRDPVEDLDQLPFPARDLVDMNAYRRLWRKRHGYHSVNVVTTRGCPFHCNWCAKPIYGQAYHARTPRNVYQEMELLRREVRADHVWFCDDIFGLKPGWIQEFADEVERGGTIIPFKCQARVDLLLKGDTIRQLARAGCANVWVGAESGSQKILDAMEKGTTVDQIVAAARRLREEGVRVGFFLQFGYPGETRQDIEMTLEMVRRCRPDDIGVSVSYPLPGTGFYERVRAQMGEKRNWTDSEDLAMMFQGTYSPDFYRVLHRLAHKRLRAWQAKDIATTMIREQRWIPRAGLRRLLAGGYHSLTLPFVERQLQAMEGKGG